MGEIFISLGGVQKHVFGVRKACGEQRRDKDSRGEASLPVRLSRRLPFSGFKFCLLCALLPCLCELAVRKQGIHSHSGPSRQINHPLFLCARARAATGDWSIGRLAWVARCMHGLVHAPIGHRHRSTPAFQRACLLVSHGVFTRCS